MIKNITLSAEERMIESARLKAQREGRSLNEVFREWLGHYTGQEKRSTVKEILDRVGRREVGGPFTRDEMNERR